MNNPGWADEVMAYDPEAVNRRPFWTRIWKNDHLMGALQKRYFDLAIDFSASGRSAQWTVWSKAALKAGLGMPSIKSQYDLAAPVEGLAKAASTEVDRRLLKLFNLSPKPHDRRGDFWRVPEKAVEYAHTFLESQPFRVRGPGPGLEPFLRMRQQQEWVPRQVGDRHQGTDG